MTSQEKLDRPSPIDTTHRFHQVKRLSSLLLIYAAILQDDSVRIIALKVVGATFKNIHCVFFRSLSETSPVFRSEALVLDIPEYQRFKHTAAYVTCPAPTHRQAAGKARYVGLANEKSLALHIMPNVILPLEGSGNEDERKEKKEDEVLGYRRFNRLEEPDQNVGLTVCVPAMYGFNNAAQLVEKIEMSRLLGAERIVLYNYSISPNIDAVLRMYAREWSTGKETLEIKVFPWHLPLIEQNGQMEILNIHYLGQMATIDHCLHRYRKSSKYIAFTDMDEFVIPLQHNTLLDLVADRQSRNASTMGFLFQCSVFNKDRPSLAPGFEEDARRYGSAVLGVTSRDDFYFPPRVRSKFIVDPKKVDVMGIHFIWNGSGSIDTVPLDQGFLAHYRDPLKKSKPGVVDTRVVDRFGKRLVVRLRKVWSKLKGVDLDLSQG
ncbi:hypothetical protein EGW08_002556 [Elysia chlorotica]|uniref:Glycosyltransferase family 92 protein n=1 Tax=Elysia chlorotica TaxID=188477 RepID=A0A3S1BJG4_ELYCH|nr:hypothetical protein EGW08_002556 [Elysia chlorotica]